MGRHAETPFDMRMETLFWIAGAAALVYWLSRHRATGAATPLSVYPSMAATAAQQAPAAVIPPSSTYSAAQAQEQSALFAQCVGTYPVCTPMAGDTQLGL